MANVRREARSFPARPAFEGKSSDTLFLDELCALVWGRFARTGGRDPLTPIQQSAARVGSHPGSLPSVVPEGCVSHTPWWCRQARSTFDAAGSSGSNVLRGYKGPQCGDYRLRIILSVEQSDMERSFPFFGNYVIFLRSPSIQPCDGHTG